MNPPDEFVAFAAAMDTQPERVNSPIVIGQGGQAVMIPPVDQPPVDAAASADAGSQAASAAQATQQTGNSAADTQAAATTTEATAVATTPSMATATPQQTDMQATTAPPMPTMDLSSATPSPTGTSWAGSAVSTGESSSEVATPTSAASSPTQTLSATTITASISGSSSSSTAITASVSASVSASSVADNTPHSFTRSAPFIFLVVLGSLVLIAVLATSLSWVFRRPCFPCWDSHPDDDEDGLSDLVASFHSHTPSRSSTIRRNAYDDDPESDLHRRASAFATDPTQSPFLHSYSMGPNMSGLWGLPPTAMAGTMGSGNAAPSIQVPAPAHLYGGGGPLEIRNAVPGEMDHAGLAPVARSERLQQPGEMLAGGSASPRFLGLDGR